MAHVMRPGTGRIPGPYPDNQYIPTTTHGWVHANTWFASAPFNSAPPPAPAGINPQTWASGRWQPNPYFRPPPNMTQPHPGFQMWAPHPGWGNGMAPGQDWNPYKRKPNPGDAAYWATELSDNPLKLENMHIRDDTPAEERRRKDSSNGVPHTPWVWVPKELAGENNQPSQSSDASASNGQRQHDQNQNVLPPPPQSQQHIHDHARTNSSSRNAYPPSTAHETSSQSRHYQHDASRSAPSAQDRVPSSAPAAVSSYSAYHQQQQQKRHQQQQQQQQHQQQHQQYQQSQTPVYPTPSQQYSDMGQRHQRQSSRNVSPRRTQESLPHASWDPRSQSTSSASASAAATASRQTSTDSMSSTTSAPYQRESRRDDSYSAKQELLPTFSPKIVCTPDRYQSPRREREDSTRTPRRSSRDATPTPTPSRGQIYAPMVPTRQNSLNAGQPPGSGSSFGLGDVLSNFTEEPDSVLSPLVVPGAPPESTRPSPRNDVTRSYTAPSVSFFNAPEDNRARPVFRKTPRGDTLDLPRDRDDEGRYREEEIDATPQPRTRTPPAHTPPLSSYTRPSPEHRSGAQPIGRSYTLPAVIPPPPPPITPQRSRSPGRSSRYSPPRSHAQTYPPPYNQPSSTPYPRTSPNPTTTQMSTSSSSPLRHNPLPRPPQLSPYAEQLTRGTSSASAAAQQQQQQQQQQPQHRPQVRLGYWNKRGDHLYMNEHGERWVVYAPRHLANPEELKGYPSPTEGWMDHRGSRLRYDGSVRELKDSLPHHGEPPLRPYQDFVRYTYV
ncbi:hypothetical protein C8Q77DRAFT_1156615 [Trametes polyzona]|nr:hypothetical protein C8Q77DRAFT_1156615 [Trametes polyzona]